MVIENVKLAVVGLGYVGLPLAVEFAKFRKVIGFDIDEKRVEELKNGQDNTRELDHIELASAKGLVFSSNFQDLLSCNVYIITVPTPVDSSNRPDISTLLAASALIAGALSPGDVVIYESTVYPGVTEYECGPVLEKGSGLSYSTTFEPAESNVFYLGYSPERINPGDKKHKLTDIVKLTSGSTPEIACFVDQLYASIITAGTHKTESICIAEAAKVIENIQRDVNIALVNELTVIFEKLEIDTEAVLIAAGTKWNFLPFRPGFVGGHCIGVDPYYLAHKSLQLGHNPEIILAGRRINESMSGYAADRIIKAMLRRDIDILGSRILVLGLAFKENCPDVRNSKIFDLADALADYRCCIDVHDPWVNPDVLDVNLGFKFLKSPEFGVYDAVILAVAHDTFVNQGATSLRKFGKPGHLMFDLKYALNASDVDERL